MAILTQTRLKQIIKEEVSKALREEQQVSTEEAQKIVNDPALTKKLVKFFMENPQVADKVIQLNDKVEGMNEGKFGDFITNLNKDDPVIDFAKSAKAFYKDKNAAWNALAGIFPYAVGSIMLGAINGDPQVQALAVGGGSAAIILSHLADIAMHSKKK